MQVTDGKKKVLIVKEQVLDGKPLDFSYKNLRSLKEIITTEPRSGERLPIPQEESVEEKKDNNLPGNPNFPKSGESEEVEEDSPKKVQQLEPFKAPQAPAVMKILQEQTTSKTAANSMPGHTDDNQASVVKKVKISYKTSSIMLSYNTIPDLVNLCDIFSKVVKDYQGLRWVDLSYNHLTALDRELCELPNLMSLYLHNNYVSDMKEVLKLEQSGVKSLTMYGNPIDQLPGYRMYVITLVPQIKRLDSVLISKLEKDNSLVFARRISIKKLPYLEKPPVPVMPKDKNAEEEGGEEEKSA
jgi:Leucine-rich repeat (LRR) protein